MSNGINAGAYELKLRQFFGKYQDLLDSTTRELLDTITALRERITELENRPVATAEQLMDHIDKVANRMCKSEELKKVERERDELIREVRAWACANCNTVFPGGPAYPGLKCVVCPSCGEVGMRPLLAYELEKVERERDELRGRVDELERLVEMGPVPPACSVEDFAGAALGVDAGRVEPAAPIDVNHRRIAVNMLHRIIEAAAGKDLPNYNDVEKIIDAIIYAAQEGAT